jgi:MFS family permease
LAAVVGIGAFVRRVMEAHDPLVPPSLFRSRDFTVTNLSTFVVYAAIGVTFFLVTYELQVAAGWSAVRAGAALLPATGLMFLLSAQSGALAERIGPRAQLASGPLVIAAGLVMLGRIGPDVSWTAQVLPASLLFGLGLVTFVAPLTATVMGSVGPDHVSVASGVNNAVARTGSLAALCVIPVVAGMTGADGAAEVTLAFRRSLWVAAAVALTAAPVAFFGTRPHVRARRSARRLHCAVDGPPLQAHLQGIHPMDEGTGGEYPRP